MMHMGDCPECKEQTPSGLDELKDYVISLSDKVEEIGRKVNDLWRYWGYGD